MDCCEREFESGFKQGEDDAREKSLIDLTEIIKALKKKDWDHAVVLCNRLFREYDSNEYVTTKDFQ